MNRVAKSLLLGGLVAGTVDIGAAAVLSAASPLLILRFVATGLLGRPALEGGTAIVLLGLLLQWGMSILIAAVYSLAASKWPVLARRWLVWGAFYGVVVFVVMNYVVVPLSAAPHKWEHPLTWYVGNGLAMWVFGWIVAFVASRCLLQRNDQGKAGYI